MRKGLPKIIVTGGAGFIGSEFVRLAVGKGYPVAVLDKLTYAGDLERLKEVQGKYKFYKVDICDKTKVRKIFKKEKPKLVVHFAAESHVDRSILESSAFIYTNIGGTQVLLDSSRMSGAKKFIHVSCYDLRTRALTTEGLKTYKELRRGDKVFTLNPVSQEIEIKPVEKVIVQNYKGKMYHFLNKRTDLLVTPNHRMFILNTSKQRKKLLIESAEEASQRSIFFFPEGSWPGKDVPDINVKGFGAVKTKDLFYVLGAYIGDGFTAFQEKEIETISGLSKQEFLKKARNKESGRFEEIEKQGNYKSKCRGYRIFFDVPKNDKCRKRLEKSLSNLGIKYHAHKGKSGEHLYFTSKAFLDFFKQCGQGASNKHIPSWALEYAPEYLKCLLEGLLDSDGSRNVIFYTVSKNLALNFCELCIKLGLKPNLKKRHTESSFKGRMIKGDSYYISIGKTSKSISHNRIKKVNYNGIVWCLKVKDNRNLLVERGGRFNFCGNTDEVYGDIERGEFHETSPLNPSSPYSASKAAADLLVKSYIRTYNFPAIIIRPSNNYGPWQYPEKFIPRAILNVLKNKKIPVYARGQNIREWLYVSDCANAILSIMEKAKIGEVYNLGSAEERKNIEVAKMILGCLGENKNFIQFVKDRPGHDFRYKLDCKKIKKQIKWKPKIKFEEGLRRTISWYIKHKPWVLSKSRVVASLYK